MAHLTVCSPGDLLGRDFVGVRKSKLCEIRTPPSWPPLSLTTSIKAASPYAATPGAQDYHREFWENVNIQSIAGYCAPCFRVVVSKQMKILFLIFCYNKETSVLLYMADNRILLSCMPRRIGTLLSSSAMSLKFSVLLLKDWGFHRPQETPGNSRKPRSAAPLRSHSSNRALWYTALKACGSLPACPDHLWVRDSAESLVHMALRRLSHKSVTRDSANVSPSPWGSYCLSSVGSAGA